MRAMARRKMTTAELEPDRPVHELDLIVLRRYPSRHVVGRKYTGPMAAACARDRSGVVGLLLWGTTLNGFDLDMLFVWSAAGAAMWTVLWWSARVGTADCGSWSLLHPAEEA